MKKKIVLVGGGGHCVSCIDVILADGGYEIAGIIDVRENVGKNLAGYPVIGCDDDIPSIASKHGNFLVTIGQVKTPEARVRLFELLKKLDVRMPVIVSPHAIVSTRAEIGEGSIVMHGAIVNRETKIGKNCILNSMSLVEHETAIGDHCHISTGAVVNGQCRVGTGSFIGSGAVLANNVIVAANTVIGAGAVVIRDITETGAYAGNPARRIG